MSTMTCSQFFSTLSRSGWRLIAVACLAFSCAQAADVAGSSPMSVQIAATVYGKVYNNVTKAVITTASVSAPPYTVNYSSGRYTFSTPGAATVDVTASAPGYTPKTITVSVASGEIKKVDFYLNPL